MQFLQVLIAFALVDRGVHAFGSPLATDAAAARQISLHGWFSGGKSPEANDAAAKENLGGVAGIMDSMENFKKVQSVGKMTGNLVKDLASTTVEGTDADGKVKIVFDAQQRPVSVDIDEAFFDAADVLKVSNAVTAALKDGYAKSIERMDEKTKSFYTNLGLKA